MSKYKYHSQTKKILFTFLEVHINLLQNSASVDLTVTQTTMKKSKNTSKQYSR